MNIHDENSFNKNKQNTAREGMGHNMATAFDCQRKMTRTDIYGNLGLLIVQSIKGSSTCMESARIKCTVLNVRFLVMFC